MGMEGGFRVDIQNTSFYEDMSASEPPQARRVLLPLPPAALYPTRHDPALRLPSRSPPLGDFIPSRKRRRRVMPFPTPFLHPLRSSHASSPTVPPRPLLM
jgi:hypothetical protein